MPLSGIIMLETILSREGLIFGGRSIEKIVNVLDCLANGGPEESARCFLTHFRIFVEITSAKSKFWF